jgi:hypothetical protein
MTKEEAARLMREDKIANFSVDRDGKVTVKRSMAEHVADPDWKGLENTKN